MKPFGKLTTRLDAVRLIDENTRRITRVEEVAIGDAAGRVLAEDVVAGFNVPPFNRSSMDGYAVRARDTAGASAKPVTLRLIGARHAGEIFDGVVGAGECVEIATGAPVPKGADAVVMVEYTKLAGDGVEVQREAKPGSNVAPEGEDIKKGEAVVKAGEVLTPGRVGAVAALGFSKVKAYAKPRVAIYSTGNEVVPQGKPLKPGQVYDINSYTLSAVVAANGCVPVRRGLVRDDFDAIAAAVKDASTYDVAVFSGGSSVGVRDLFAGVVEDLGRVHFHGLRVKPGKPTLFGEVGGTPVFGMPGYSTSCLNNAYVLLVPALRKVAGLPPAEERTVKARLSRAIKAEGEREQFYSVRVEGGEAVPVFKQSGDITSMAYANGYIIIPIGTQLLEAGDEVNVYLFA
ncbi:MAG: molybdopterin molybdotransferase MoeA [Candidatus Bathyarchaeota archaeon]|nr:molybdopterin molybdotransferase MoeA [Candidatus Bathyarchaeota archaeon]